jgi:uncharacterized protein
MRRTLAAVVAVVTLMLVPTSPATAADPVVLTDVYIEMDDGVRLAADVYLPPGTPTDGSVQVPCLVELTPYRKEARAAEAVSVLPDAGFGVIEVDIRGTGGSEGEYDIVFSLREQWDAAEVIDWAAKESGWCTDRVGMFGGSYSGIIQYLTASLPPDRAARHLATIAPQRAYGDLYRDIVYHGGQTIGSFGLLWSSAATALYTQPPTNLHTPEGIAAWSDHLTKNDPMWGHYLDAPYADATYTSDDSDPGWTQQLYADSSVLPRIEHLDVPVLHLAGWFDTFTRGQLLTFQAAHERERRGEGGPHYLIVGPWNHAGTHFVTPEHDLDRLLDWYRYWLADGPEPAWFGPDRVRYYELGAGTLDDDTGTWRTAPSWPPPVEYQRLYLRADGSLSFDQPEEAEAAATYVFDPSTGVAAFPSRWDNAVPAVPHPQHDQRIDGDRAGLTFQTPAVEEPMSFAGPLVLRMHVATEGLDVADEPAAGPVVLDHVLPPYHDTDFVVKVSDVAPDGTAQLLTEGFLRASHRAVDRDRSQIVAGEVVVPFHPHTRESLQPPVPGETHEYVVEVWPTAKSLQPGHRLRVDLYSADLPNHLNLLRPAVNTVSLDASQPSYLLLPVSAADGNAPPPDITGEDAPGATAGADAPMPLPATGAGAGLLAPLLLGAAEGLRRATQSGRSRWSRGRSARRRARRPTPRGS